MGAALPEQMEALAATQAAEAESLHLTDTNGDAVSLDAANAPFELQLAHESLDCHPVRTAG